MKVGVMGAGRVGLASALVLCELGHDVTLFDVDKARLARLRAGELPFFEPDAAESLQASVEEHPIQSVLVALGLGVVVGMLLRR